MPASVHMSQEQFDTRIKDLRGLKSGKLTVMSLASQNPVRWNCICDCGTACVVSRASLSGRSDPTRSCGCLLVGNTKHGLCKSPEYRSYRSAISRCEDPANASYARYGGNGIHICQVWRDDFSCFLRDMGRMPPNPPRWTIERIDNAKGYEPGNCRWATYKEQQNHKTNNHLVTYRGRVHTVSQLSKILGISPFTIKDRVKRNISLEDALKVAHR